MEQTQYSLFFVLAALEVLLKTSHRAGIDVSGALDYEALFCVYASQRFSQPWFEELLKESVVVFVFEVVEL